MAKNVPHTHENTIQRDDFKLIAGINQGIENRLHKAGIRTYAQLESLTPQKILLKLGKVKGYTLKRIEDEDWIGQARKRRKQRTRHKSPSKTTTKPEIHQHYENFTIEFLLDEKNVSRRTRVLHIQSGDADTWAGWEPDQLVSFLARHAGMSLVPRMEVITSISESHQEAVIPAKQPSIVTRETAKLLLPTEAPEKDSNSFLVSSRISKNNLDLVEQSPAGITPSRPSSLEANRKDLEKIHLLEWKIFPQDANFPARLLHHNQIFTLNLMLDFDRGTYPIMSDLKYCATIYAKQIGTRNRQSIGEVQNIIPVSNNANVNINCVNLTPGIYRLEALLTLESSRQKAGQHLPFKELLECGLFQVY